MDPPRASDSRRRGGGRGGKPRSGKQLGLKRPAAPAPSSPSPPLLTPLPATSASDASVSAPATNPTTATATNPTRTPVAASSSPSAPMFYMPPRQPQGGLGGMPPGFPFGNGEQQSPNSWLYPPGGFVNMIQQNYQPLPQQQGENFHLVGQSVSFNPMSPQPPQGTANNRVNIDEAENIDANRAAKKGQERTMRYWTHEEEERLASAWLNASKDPIHGNDKKGETFWKEVTEMFNNKGEGKRIRELNQLKVHWCRLKSLIGDFNDYWTKVCQLYTSGYSDDMLEKEAQKMYVNRFGKPFTLVHWWKILKEEPKWCALFETEKEKTEAFDIPEEQKRPIGRESAKAERNGKHKKAKVKDEIVNLGDTVEKLVKVQEDRKMDLEKAAEAQIQISITNLKAATEEKEAKMFEVYNTMLNKDTSNMSESQKANHERAIHKLQQKLLGD